RCTESITGEDFYREMSRRGLCYGPSFQGVKHVWRRAGEAIAHVSLDAAFADESAHAGVHPLLLDNCLQVIACALPSQAGAAEGVTYLPVGVERVRVGRQHSHAGATWSYASIQAPVEETPAVLTADAMLLNQAGEVVLELRGVRLQRVRGRLQTEAALARVARPDESLRVKEADVSQWLYEIEWRQTDIPSSQL